MLTNIINTSSSYDSTVRAPFRFEKITASYNKNTINIELQYYINTNESAEISFTVNGHSKNDILSSARAKKSIRKIELALPNNGEHNTLKINFSAIFAQSYNMDGTFYFDDNTKEDHKINEPGQYRYKVIKEIAFINKTKTFLYKYNYINLNVLPRVDNVYNTYSYVIDVDSSNTKSFTKLWRNDEFVFEGLTAQDIKSALDLPGNYSSETVLKYRVGQVAKDIKLNYKWNINKNYKGECKDSYICLLDDKITGILEETISTNLIL